MQALQRGKGTLWKRIKHRRFCYLLLLPVMVYYVIFCYMPMWGLSIAFMDYKVFQGIRGSPWIGFKNFIDFFTGRMFMLVLRNTLILNIQSLIVGFPAPIIFAIMLNEVHSIKYKRTVQTITYMPHFISTVVLVSMMVGILSPTNGFVNQVIMRFGNNPIYFMNEAKYFRFLSIASGIWQGTGWGSIIYLAAISSIDTSLYEAAIIDGASRMQRVRFITIPSILGIIMIMLILRMGQMLNADFEKVFLMQTPGNRNVSELIATYVYDRGIRNSDYGFATAVGFFNSVVSFALIILSNFASKVVTQESLW